MSRQIETIPEYESDIVPNTLPKTQSNNNNNNSRRLPAPNKSSIINTNRTLVKRPENQAVPVANKNDTFVHIPEQVTIEKNFSTGMNISIYNKLL